MQFPNSNIFVLSNDKLFREQRDKNNNSNLTS